MWTKMPINKELVKPQLMTANMAKISKCRNGILPLMVEVLAIEEAMELAIQCGQRKKGFFSDSKIATETIKNS